MLSLGEMKRNLVIGIRKTHKYTENHKVSDYLVPYTSSGMQRHVPVLLSGMPLQQMRLSPASLSMREQMLERLIKRGQAAFPADF